jgi:hypothetical protein
VPAARILRLYHDEQIRHEPLEKDLAVVVREDNLVRRRISLPRLELPPVADPVRVLRGGVSTRRAEDGDVDAAVKFVDANLQRRRVDEDVVPRRRGGDDYHDAVLLRLFRWFHCDSAGMRSRRQSVETFGRTDGWIWMDGWMDHTGSHTTALAW